MPAHIKGVRYASNFRDAAVDTDIGDVCLIEFSDENPSEFFGNSPYIIDEKTIEGTFLCTANDQSPVEIMMAEAMAQLAGGLVFREAHGFLTGIDDCAIDRRIEPGDVITFTVTLDAQFGGTYRFVARGK